VENVKLQIRYPSDAGAGRPMAEIFTDEGKLFMVVSATQRQSPLVKAIRQLGQGRGDVVYTDPSGRHMLQVEFNMPRLCRSPFLVVTRGIAQQMGYRIV